MNINQINYFLTAANCMSFTKAANQLYITQPALSRQIQMMEKELGVILFLRSSRKFQLTPAAVILKEEFQKIYDSYYLAVAKAHNAYQGKSGTLEIGILEGTRVGDLFPKVLQYFEKNYPNVTINMRNYSFKMLLEGLHSGKLDLAITLKFDIEEQKSIDYRIIEKTHDHIVVHKNHRLANRKSVNFSDLDGETFIMVSTEDSLESPRLILNGFKNAGVTPKVRFAPSIQAEMLWVESGIGVCMLDTRNILYDNPAVKFLNIDSVSDPSLSLAWSKENTNPFVPYFIDNFTYNV